MPASAAALSEPVRTPVHLASNGLIKVEQSGLSIQFFQCATHADREEILADGWFNTCGNQVYVDDVINIAYGPHPFDFELQAKDPTSAHFRGGAQPHDFMTVRVVDRRAEMFRGNPKWSVKVKVI